MGNLVTCQTDVYLPYNTCVILINFLPGATSLVGIPFVLFHHPCFPSYKSWAGFYSATIFNQISTHALPWNNGLARRTSRSEFKPL